ncbi:Lrp/AsnC family transcriptional regulator [Companilactobacillus mishanensis]|uniref:Lrp/AsnC family transcriptional regulator n=1 Tax=Companilactobacillus mishanensis TaxID=2486008 RepID=A0ABW9P9T8_9LACO|nr:Lrp/AsnC family transcriptional regulator [Companilactobacillus mishanensis]MQS45973.1 Lrp/AsnC family transcriptional regulator [Companilactobacillus mishanensis]
MVDDTDIEILKHLNRNSRIKNKRLAELVHLTAPAVAARIDNLVESGVIKKYTLEVDTSKLDFDRQVFIQVAITNFNHEDYLKFIKTKRNLIRHHYKTSGDMNYLIECSFHTTNDLNDFLDNLDKYANYRVIDIISQLI